MSEEKGIVLLLGDLGNESVINEIKLAGKDYIHKIFNSSPDNWGRMSNIICEGNISHVIVKITESVLHRCCFDDYFDQFKNLLNVVKEKPHIVFIYDENLSYKFNSLESGYYVRHKGRFSRVSEEETVLIQKKLTEIIDYIVSADLNIIPFRRRLEIPIALQVLFDETTKGLLLKLYVSKQQLWEKEIGTFLSLFNDYLTKIKGVSITINETHSEHGIIYSFYSCDNSVDSFSLQSGFTEFSSFLDLCSDDLTKALKLVNTSLPKDDLQRLMNKYSIEAKRLMVDLKYEYQTRMLQIQHRFDSEIIEAEAVGQLGLQNLSFTVGKPEIASVSDLTTFNGILNNINVNVNNAQIISNVKGIVANEIYGGITYNEYDKQLIDIFKGNAKSDAEFATLKTYLDELKDTSVEEKSRTSAWQKTKAFILKQGPIIGQVGINLLEKYLDGLLFGSNS
jgi:hypothetical protein